MKFLEILRAKAEALTAQRAAAVETLEAASAAAVAEQRSTLTDAETAAHDEARAAVEAIDSELADIESRIGELEAIDARARNAATVPFNVNVTGTKDSAYDIDLRTAPRTAEVVADCTERAKRAIGEERTISDDQKAVADDLLRNKDRGGVVARHIIATGRPEYRSAFSKLTTQVNPVLTQQEAAALDEVRAMTIGTDSTGGYLMPFTLDPTIILTNNGAINPLRDLATVKTVVTDNWQGVSSAGVTAAYGAESAVVADGTPTLAQPTVAIHKAHAFVPFTMEAEDDLANLGNDAAVMFNDAKMRLEATKFTLGSGSAQPYGIVTVLSGVSGSKVASASTDTYAVADVYAVQNALPARYRANAKWMAALPIINLTRAFGSSLGHAFLTDLAGGVPPLLLGQSLRENSDMDSTITGSAENYVLVYGDFSAYRIHDRIGLSIELVPHLFDTSTGRPTGERGWYARWRNGANLVDTNALRLLNVT